MGFELVYGILLGSFFVFYAIIILAFTAGLIKTSKHLKSGTARVDDTPSPQPANFVSVIIPVRNEAGNILRILEEMRNQDFPVSLLEVIVADDYSEDSTLDSAGRFAKQFPGFPLVLIPSGLPERGEGGKKQAVQRAVDRAKGEIIVCTDADCVHGPGWVSSMAGSFGYKELQMVLGPVVFHREKNLLQKIQSLEFMGIMGTTAGSAGLGYPVMCNGASLGYRRSAFIDTGGYGANLQFGSGDDQFLMASVRKRYGKKAIRFNNYPAAIVSTEAEATITGFLNQRIRWVSKSRGYRDPMVIGVGLVTWLIHLLLLGGLVSGLFYPKILALSLALWLGKMVLEYPVVWFMSRFFGKKELRGYYLPAQAFQLVYVVMVGMLGLFLPYRWKGRKMNR